MRVVVGTVLHPDQRNRHIRPRLAQQLELELIHVGRLAVQEDEQRQFRHPWCWLPAEDGVEASVAVRLVLVLEIRGLDDLPPLHDLRPAAEPRADFHPPVLSPFIGRQLPDIRAVGAEGHGVNAVLLRVFALCARDHVVQDSVDEVLGEADVGRLVVVAEDTVWPHHAAVRVPGHTAGDVEQEHGFEVVGAVEDAFGELVQGAAARVVGYVGDLGGVFVGFDLPVALEHVARAVVLGDDVAVDHDLAGIALVATPDDRVHVLKTG